MLPVPTISYLALFTGRAEDTFSTYADQALIQATLLFSTITKREDFPDDDDQQSLAVNAILEMADRIYLEQPYATVRASPYNSESIGSYSYSKGTTAYKAKNHEPTGLFWWELAVEELSLVDRSLVTSGAVTVFDNDSMYTDDITSRKTVLGPADMCMPDIPYDVNAEKYPRDPLH